MFIVKDNQPTLRQDIVDLDLKSFPPQHTTTDKARGRLEVRQVWTSTSIDGLYPVSHGAQVFCLQCNTSHIVSQKSHTETVFGITSLTPGKRLRLACSD